MVERRSSCEDWIVGWVETVLKKPGTRNLWQRHQSIWDTGTRKKEIVTKATESRKSRMTSECSQFHLSSCICKTERCVDQLLSFINAMNIKLGGTTTDCPFQASSGSGRRFIQLWQRQILKQWQFCGQWQLFRQWQLLSRQWQIRKVCNEISYFSPKLSLRFAESLTKSISSILSS